MTAVRNAVRTALRRHQAAELVTARRCPDCGQPLGADVTARLTVTGSRFGDRMETDADIGACTCRGNGSVPTAGNAAMETAPPRSPTQIGEGSGLRPVARVSSRTDQRTVAQGSPVEWTRGPEPSTVELGVGRRRPAGPPLATRFQLRTWPHHRTDAESLAVVYQVKAQLRAQESLHEVAERTEFHSCRMDGGEWLQHIELSGRCDPAGWPVLGRMVARHPGWVLSWE